MGGVCSPALQRISVLVILLCSRFEFCKCESRVAPSFSARETDWSQLFQNRRRLKRLITLKIFEDPESNVIQQVLKRRVEELYDHDSLGVFLNDVKPCSAASSGTSILYWPCSLPSYSKFQPYSASVAFFLVAQHPLENAIGRFYESHETDHMKSNVPISKYFKTQSSGRFSEEHLQHIRAYVVGGREFLKSNPKYRIYHNLGNPQYYKLAKDPEKALDIIKSLLMVVSTSDELEAFLILMRRRMGWPVRQIIHTPKLKPNHPTLVDWPEPYVLALNNTPKVCLGIWHLYIRTFVCS
jgi:hypothetical protein